jgi:hypothetical protein
VFNENMELAMDTTIISQFFALPFDQQLRWFLINIGWIPIAGVILYGAKEVWLYWRQILFDATLGYTLLAIDIPRGNEQSPKAVENMFTYFGGAHGTYTLFEEYWEGKFQQGFSFEIVCIDGYTQFLIRTPKQFRNLVESAVYSQYPDAEITEVNDYTEGIPTKYPDDEYDVWGCEFIYAKNEAYPLKIWPQFISEMPGRPEGQFKDPMASLMDLCSSLKKGEQLWYQMIVYPTDFDWTKRLQKEAGKIMGDPGNGGSGLVGGLFSGIMAWLSEFSAAIFGGEPAKSQESQVDQFRIFALTPQQKKQVEAIQHKTSQLGFKAKHRFVYVGKKEIFNKPKVVSGFVGYIKQFMDLDLNNLKPDLTRTGTSTAYFFADSRLRGKQARIVTNFRNRSGLGKEPKISTIDELATLWHFPIEATVRAPLIQKAPGRKAEPPMTLPQVEEAPSERIFEPGKAGEDNMFEASIPARPVRTRPQIPVRREGETKEEKPTKEDIPSEQADFFADADQVPIRTRTRPQSKPPSKGAPPNNLPIS